MNFKEIIIFEDNHLLVIEKPAGYASLPNEDSIDILTEAKAYIKERDEKKGNVFLQPVHRLDKQVSGILVLAKTSKALSRLNEQIRNKDWEKVYIAELTQPLPKKSGELKHFLCKRKYFADVYTSEKPFSKIAILHYEHLKGNFYKVNLKTGRYHQIRAQMGFVKCPIVGDQKYKAPKQKSKALHLHHAHLTLKHPVTNDILQLDSNPMFM
ncbi:MAG: Ribosomal large subunit pseudouridine synthase C [Chlamydiia bacterium]|nr:Ribosomal large subunit pseudouridine synthase C [Chlamydiia bacterium]